MRTFQIKGITKYEGAVTGIADWGQWSASTAEEAAQLLFTDVREHPENYTGKPVLVQVKEIL